jgi:hypothetical protein
MNIQITWAGLLKEITRLDMGQVGFQSGKLDISSWMHTVHSLPELLDFDEYHMECRKKIHSGSNVDRRLVS